MELAYLWCNECGKFGKVSLNFSVNFNFEIAPSCIIIRKKDSYIENIFSEYYPNINNVSAFVGANGSGKTTILKKIMSCFEVLSGKKSHNVNYLSQFIMIFYEGSNFVGYKSADIEFNVKVPHKCQFSWGSRNDISMCIASVTNAFNYQEYAVPYPKTIDGWIYNMSNSYLMKMGRSDNLQINKADNAFETNHIIYAWHESIKRQIEAYNFVPFEINKITIRLIGDESNARERLWSCFRKRQEYLEESAINRLLIIWDTVSSRAVNSMDSFIVKGVLYSLYMWLGNNTSEWDKEKASNILDVINEEFCNEDIYQKSEQKLEKVLEKFFSCMPGGIESYITIIKSYTEIIKKLKLSPMFSFGKENKVDMLLGKNSELLSKFYDSYLTAICGINEFLFFEWNISSGESALMDMYGKVYAVHKRIKQHKYINNVLFIFDEIDLYLHPEWQQKCLKQLLEYLNMLFSNINVQIILATHSPILLSDIPSDNIFYLENNQIEKKVDNRTFGENIYRLYKDSFFMCDDNRIGISGDFSSRCILDWMDVFRKLLSGEMTKTKCHVQKVDNIKNKLQIIAEPLIRNTLCCMYHELMMKWKKKDDEFLMEIKFARLSKEEKIKLLDLSKKEELCE